MRRASKTTSLILTALFIISVIPVASVSADSTDNNAVYYGIEYDWSNIDGDLEGLTGLDFDGMLQDVMDAASEAGFTLVIAEITTGSSNMYVSSVEDHTTQTIQNAGGGDVEVWSRTTVLSIRHAVLADTALLTDWDETKFGGTETSFDIQVSANGENTFTTDATYVEYFDSDYNLTGADLVIHFDPWWNPAAEAQATDRAHRIGQTKTVQVYKLIVADSVEENVLRLQSSKRKLLSEVFEAGEAANASISMQDLKELI